MVLPHAGFYGADNLVTAGGVVLDAGTLVSVYDPGTTNLAALWTDRDRSAAAPNPVPLDQWGNLSFYAEAGPYDVDAGAGPVRIVAQPDADDVAGGGTGSGVVAASWFAAAGDLIAGTDPLTVTTWTGSPLSAVPLALLPAGTKIVTWDAYDDGDPGADGGVWTYDGAGWVRDLVQPPSGDPVFVLFAGPGSAGFFGRFPAALGGDPTAGYGPVPPRTDVANTFSEPQTIDVPLTTYTLADLGEVLAPALIYDDQGDEVASLIGLLLDVGGPVIRAAGLRIAEWDALVPGPTGRYAVWGYSWVGPGEWRASVNVADDDTILGLVTSVPAILQSGGPPVIGTDVVNLDALTAAIDGLWKPVVPTNAFGNTVLAADLIANSEPWEIDPAISRHTLHVQPGDDPTAWPFQQVPVQVINPGPSMWARVTLIILNDNALGVGMNVADATTGASAGGTSGGREGVYLLDVFGGDPGFTVLWAYRIHSAPF